MKYTLKLNDADHLDLIRAYKQTDSQSAFKSLYDEYFKPGGLIDTRIKSYPHKKLSYDELFHVCIESFLNCVNTFDPDHEKVKSQSMTFHKWVNIQINRSIKTSLAKAHMHPELGKADYEMLNKINIVWQQLIDEAGLEKKVTVEDVASNLEMPFEIIDGLLKIVDYAKYLEHSLNFEIAEGTTLVDTIAAEDKCNIYTTTNFDSFREQKPDMVEAMNRSQSATVALLHGDDDLASIIFERQIMTNPALRSEVIASYGDFEDEQMPSSLRNDLNQFFTTVIRECKKPMPFVLKKNLGLISD